MASLRLFALPCGWLGSDLGLFLAGERGEIRVPVPSWLILHPAGAAVFDTGLHVATQLDPVARLGETLASLFRVDFAPGQELAAQLRALEIDPGAIRTLVASHLHFDHVGGNAQLPNARLVIQRAEWEAGQDPELRARCHYDPRDYDLGHDRLLVEGEHDLFGDGSVTCLPTPGHTPGHQSLRVRLPTGEVVLSADACYLRRSLEALQLPPVVFDARAARAALLRLGELERRGARLFFGHDPAPWLATPRQAFEIR